MFSGITALPISGAPEQECRTISTTFYLLKMFFNRTTLNNTAETEQLTQKFLKCRMRKRRPLDWLVIQTSYNKAKRAGIFGNNSFAKTEPTALSKIFLSVDKLSFIIFFFGLLESS